MLTRVRHILEMIRFSHTLFALPFALLAALLACRLLGAEAALRQGIVQEADATHTGVTKVSVIKDPNWTELRQLVHEFPAVRKPVFVWPWMRLFGILLCMVMGRSAAMAFNRLADRKIDAM